MIMSCINCMLRGAIYVNTEIWQKNHKINFTAQVKEYI